jgi:hypothetical protein
MCYPAFIFRDMVPFEGKNAVKHQYFLFLGMKHWELGTIGHMVWIYRKKGLGRSM